MKLILPTLLAAAITGNSSAAVVAFWDFNNFTPVADDSVQIVHNASQGSGTIYQQRADTDGNGKLGNAFTDPVTSLPLDAGKAMGWNDVAKSGDNDAEFFVTFSTTGFDNIIVSFDISGNSVVGAGINSFDLKYAFTALEDVAAPSPWAGTKDFVGGISTLLIGNQSIVTPTDGSFVRLTYNLSTLISNLANGDSANNQGVLTIRFDDWKSNDDMAIDNLLVTGTAIPEPSALLLAALAGLGLLRRRRTQS